MTRIRTPDPAEGMEVTPDPMGTDVYPLQQTSPTIRHRCKDMDQQGKRNAVEPLRFRAGLKHPRDPSLGGGTGKT